MAAICVALGWSFAVPTAHAAPAGTMAAWGEGSVGELGNGTTAGSATPVLVTSADAAGSFTEATEVAAGNDNSAAVLADGTVASWGGNTSGDLGDGNTSQLTVPVKVTGVGGAGTLSGVRSIACGGYTCLALRSDGTVVAWGYGGWGGLGNGTTTVTNPTPAVVKGIGGVGTLTGVVAISAGYGHSLALLSNGTVAAWGLNTDGQLGQGSAASNSSVPLLVKGVGGAGTLTGVTAIAGGGYHSLALLSNGTVVAWGQDGSGQLGNGTTTDSLTPTPVEGIGGAGTLTGVTAIAGGGYHSLALLSNGTVVAWGNNEYGQLGDGTTTYHSFPVATDLLSNIVAIAGGAQHSLAVASNGTAYAWGDDADGQLGVDTSQSQLSAPEAVVGVGNFGLLPAVFALPTTDLSNHSLAIEGASASLSPANLTFGSQTVGIESASQTVTLTNSGPAPLMVAGETLTGSGATSFTPSADNCAGSTLAAGGSCQVKLLFVPAGAGGKSASLTFQTTAANALPGVTLTGTGVASSPNAPPVLSTLTLLPHAFRAAPFGPSIVASVRNYGTLITYADSKAAVTTFLVQRRLTGVLINGRCVSPIGRSHVHARRCTRYQTVGRFRHHDRVGLNRVRFTGRVHGHRLAPGRYRLQAVARVGGRASRPRFARFRIRFA